MSARFIELTSGYSGKGYLFNVEHICLVRPAAGPETDRGAQAVISCNDDVKPEPVMESYDQVKRMLKKIVEQ